MAAPKKNTAKKNTAKSRQPLGERSMNLPSAATTKGQKKDKIQESGSVIAAFVSSPLLRWMFARRQSESHMTWLFKIVEKKDRKGILYPAIKNDRTGCYSYQPTGRKAPICFDPSRHRLEFETTSFAKSVNKVLIAEEGGSESDKEENLPNRKRTTNSVHNEAANKHLRLESDEDDDERNSPESDDEPETTERAKSSKPTKAVAKPTKKAAKATTEDSVTEKEYKRMKRPKRNQTTKNSYKEEDESNADHDESDFEEEQRSRKKKSKTVPATTKSQVKKKRKKPTNDDDTVNTTDDSDMESQVARPSAKKSVYDPFVTASWEEGGDWRSEGAIDYWPTWRLENWNKPHVWITILSWEISGLSFFGLPKHGLAHFTESYTRLYVLV